MNFARQWSGLAAAVTLLVLTTSGCAGSDASDGAETIDVRTPEEFADGRLRDAINIDVAAPDFEDRISDLDEDATYVVYCASGNRAGQAIEQMRERGFDNLINGGGYDDLAATGLPSS